MVVVACVAPAQEHADEYLTDKMTFLDVQASLAKLKSALHSLENDFCSQAFDQSQKYTYHMLG